jgi:hypothetical protein
MGISLHSILTPSALREHLPEENCHVKLNKICEITENLREKSLVNNILSAKSARSVSKNPPKRATRASICRIREICEQKSTEASYASFHLRKSAKIREKKTPVNNTRSARSKSQNIFFKNVAPETSLFLRIINFRDEFIRSAGCKSINLFYY